MRKQNMLRRKGKKAMAACLAAGLLLAGSGCGKTAGTMAGNGEDAAASGTAAKNGGDAAAAGTMARNGENAAASGTAAKNEGDAAAARTAARAADASAQTMDSKKPAAALIGTNETKEENTEEEEGEESRVQKENTGFRKAESYREILDALSADQTSFVQWGFNQYFALDGFSGGVYDFAVNEAEAVPDADGSAEYSGRNYSDTNAQTQGVAEADIVKTDGEYIYILSKTEDAFRVFLVRAGNGQLVLESSFSPEVSENGSSWKEEMYVSGNYLVIVSQEEKEAKPVADMTEDDALYWTRWYGYVEVQTQILIYDITDRRAPVLAAKHVQDGNYVSSREKDGYLYVISEKGIRYNYIPYFDRVFEVQENAVLQEDAPAAGETLSKEECARLPQADNALLAPDGIYFRENSMDSVYTIVTSIELDKPEKFADSLSFMAESSHCYMSGNAIYLTAYRWWNYGELENDETDLVKISCQDGRLSLTAQGKVKGSLDDQFSMDEKDGCLRIVTTVNHYKLVQEGDDIWQDYIGMSNSLYVLDADLKLVGSLENLAKDEMVYSVRFLGDIAYFVTFRNTDPLFSVDVSDPAHPVLLGELKIPGFSDYLHPYGENRLLGIGYHADEEGAVNCVKLTMFDISDPLNVVEKHTLLLEDYYTSEACTNHRAVLVDEERGLIGLPLNGDYFGSGGFWDYTPIKAYAVYGYDEEQGFYPVLEKKYTRDWKYKSYYLGEIEEEEIDVPEELVQKNGDGADTSEASQTEAATSSAADDWRNKWYYMRLRGIYIGDYFYMVNPMKEVLSWQMGQEDFAEGMALELK